MSLPKQRVAIIDNIPIVRRGLRSYLNGQPDLKATIEADTPNEALELIQLDPPDLIISDALFPDSEGVFELLQAMRPMPERVPVLVFSNLNERVIASRVIQAGAKGYLMKSESEKELGSAIRRLLTGHVYLSREMTERALTTISDPSSRTHRGGVVRDLTNREFEILDMVGAGMTSKEIAATLKISLKTVESHRSHILAKLSLENSAELICYASQWRNISNQQEWAGPTVASA